MSDLTTVDPIQEMLAKLRSDQESRVGRILRGADAETELGSVTLPSPAPADLAPAAPSAVAIAPRRPGVRGDPDQGARGRAEVPPKQHDGNQWLRDFYWASRADQSPLEVF
jgi:hypothetical protein